MITKKEAEVLRHLIQSVDDARELVDRFNQGYTNRSCEEVYQELNEAQHLLDQFINTITEK